MEYKAERQKGSVKLTVTVPKAEWEQEITASYEKNKGKYNIPGFRKGHAPRKYIESLYGPTVFFDDAFNACASKAYGKALSENEDIFPVDEPSVDIDKFGDDALVFHIEVTVKPEVTLGQYKGLTVKKAEYPVTDADIDADIERARQAHSRMIDITDRAVADGDTVNIDYSGTIDGVRFNGGTAEKQDLVIGSKTFIPGFEEQLIGMNIGEERDVKVKFPDDYHSEDVKGKDAVFAVKLHAIKFREVPALDDAYVKDTTKFETVKEYRADVEKRLKENAARREEGENKNAILEKVAEGITADIPDCMVESELDYMMRDFEQRLAYMYGGIKLEDYLKYTGSDLASFRSERKGEAEKAVRTRLAIEAVIKAENTTATEEETEAKLRELAEQTKQPLEEYKKTITDRRIAQIKNDITIEKTLALLVSENTFSADVKDEPAKKPAKKTASTDTAESGAKKAPAAKTGTGAKKPATKKSTAEKSE